VEDQIAFWAKIFFVSVGLFLAGGFGYTILFGERCKYNEEEYYQKLEKVLNGKLTKRRYSLTRHEYHIDFIYQNIVFEYDKRISYSSRGGGSGGVHFIKQVLKTDLTDNFYFSLKGIDPVEKMTTKKNLRKWKYSDIDIAVLPPQFKKFAISTNNINKALMLMQDPQMSTLLFKYITSHRIIGDCLELQIGPRAKNILQLYVEAHQQVDFKPSYNEIREDPKLIMEHVHNLCLLRNFLTTV